MNDIANAVVILLGLCAGYFLLVNARKVKAETRKIEGRGP